MRALIKDLAEGKISPFIDVYEVYRCLFKGEEALESHRPYCNRSDFLSLTYVTPAMREYLRDFLEKLSNLESEVYVLPALLGAGKSHYLALVLHVLSIYRDCRGSGRCVGEMLKTYGIEVETPDVQVPRVLVFHGGHKVSGAEERLFGLKDKDEIRRFLRESPTVIIFDETQAFDSDGASFPQWLQFLSEAVREVRGSYLFVSYSLFPGGERNNLPARSLDVLNRVNPMKVALDTVSNIAEVFRRWAGVQPRGVDLSYLKGIEERLITEFSQEVKRSYPFNPKFLRYIVELAEESVIERTRIQLTRGLLRVLAEAYLNTKGGMLVTFGAIHNLTKLLRAGGAFAEYWDALFRVYERDVEKIQNSELREVGLCVLNTILVATFLARLMPQRVLYPSEDEIVLGCFNGGDVRPFDVRSFLDRIRELGLHVDKLRDRYVYWYVGDERELVMGAIFRFGDDDGLEVAIDEVVQIISEFAGPFSRVYISGTSKQVKSKIRIVGDESEWHKLIGEKDYSTLAVDIRGFGVKERRNNLVVLRAVDMAVVEGLKHLGYFAPTVKNARDAVTTLGRVIKAIGEVLRDTATYVRDLPDDSRLASEMLQLIKSKLMGLEKEIRYELRRAINRWLSKAYIGHMEREIRSLEELFREFRDRNVDHIIKTLMENLVNWDSFKRVRDLWTVFLNNEKLPAAAVSFDDFYRSLVRYCGGCRCVFKSGDEVRWLEDDCAPPQFEEDLEVAPVMVGEEFVEWAVETYLRYLVERSTGGRQFFVRYSKPRGGIEERRVDELLSLRSDWIYLLPKATLEVRQVERFIEVKIDGLPQSKVERKPGEIIRVRIDSSHELSEVGYEVGGVEKRESVSGKSYEFEIRAPSEPGEYTVVIEAVFKDGSRDARNIILKVPGLCRKSRRSSRVNPDVHVEYIEVSTVADAIGVIETLTSYDISFQVELDVEVGAPKSSSEFLKVAANMLISEKAKGDDLRRLLKAVERFMPVISARIYLKRNIDARILEDLRGYNLIYVYVEEGPC